MFEIEIEAKNDSARLNLDSIRRHLRDAVPGVSFSTASKYARGLNRLVTVTTRPESTRGPVVKPSGSRDWTLKVGFFAGVLTLVWLMALIGWSVAVRPVPCDARFLVVAVLALGSALASSFLGGDAVVNGRLPLPVKIENPVQFAAFGGVAVLLLVLFAGYLLYIDRCS
jgi:hypothetical protein